MARPTAYDRQTSFQLFSQENPATPHTGTDLDIEYNAIKLALDETQSVLGGITEADGTLKRQSVGRAQLDSSILLGFGAPALWTALTSYSADFSSVFHENKFYYANVDHVSGVSFDASKWDELADFTTANFLEDGSINLDTKAVAGSLTESILATASVSFTKLKNPSTIAFGLGQYANPTTYAALRALAPTDGDVAEMRGYLATGDGGEVGRMVYDAASTATHDAGMTIQKGSGGTGRWKRVGVGDNRTTAMFGALRNGSDETAKVQAAMDSWGPKGGILDISRGTEFNLGGLDLPAKGAFWFVSEDDSFQNPFTSRESGELNLFVFGSNASGIVNELVVTAPFNPGLVINVAKSLPIQDAFLGPNHAPGVQGRIPGTYYSSVGTGNPVSESAKASILIESERVSTFALISQEFGDDTKSKQDGVVLYHFQRHMDIIVDSTTGFNPAVGTKIQGITSGFFGYFISKTATSVRVDWQYGDPVQGEDLYDFANFCKVVSASFVDGSGNLLVKAGVQQWYGTKAISFGAPPGYNFTDFSMFGRVMLGPTFDTGQARTETITSPALVFCRDPVSAPSTGRQIVQNSDNRLVLVNGTAASTSAIGHVGAVSSHAIFLNAGSASPPSNSFNVASVVRNNTGLYTVTFITPLLATGYPIVFGRTSKDDNLTINSSGTSSFSIQNYNAAGSVADLVGTCYFATIGGH